MAYSLHIFKLLSCPMNLSLPFTFFFFNDTATTEIYTLSLHDALPIFLRHPPDAKRTAPLRGAVRQGRCQRSEEHTSELQSRQYLVCRLLLEKKKKNVTESRSTIQSMCALALTRTATARHHLHSHARTR